MTIQEGDKFTARNNGEAVRVEHVSQQRMPRGYLIARDNPSSARRAEWMTATEIARFLKPRRPTEEVPDGTHHP